MSSPSVPLSMRSERKPRVEVRPDGIVGTFGPEAIELGRRAGIEADGWQVDAVHLLLSFRADGKFACREYAEWVARQNGKGVILEIRVLAGLFLLGEQTILWSAHEFKTAKKASKRMRARFAALGTRFERRGSEHFAIDLDGEHFTVKVGQTNGQDSFEILETGQVVLFVARSKGSGRGIDAVDLNVVDETFAFTFEQQDAIGPTQRSALNPQTIYTSSPPLDGASGEVMYKLRRRAESDAPGRLGYRDFGAAGKLEDLRELGADELAKFLSGVERWANTNPALGTERLTEEDVQDDLESMSELGFAREILGIWPQQVASAGGAIDPQAWQGLLDVTSKRVGDIAIAIDVAPERTWAALSIYGLRADGVGHLELVDYRAGTAWIVPRLVQAAKALNPVAVGMGRGTYASLKEALTTAGLLLPDDPEKPERGDLAVTSGVDMAAACAQLIDAVKDRTLRHVGDKQLTAAVLGAKTKAAADSIGWSRTESGVDVSPLVAATIARWAFLTRIDLIDQEEERGPILW